MRTIGLVFKKQTKKGNKTEKDDKKDKGNKTEKDDKNGEVQE